ncbi:S8 family serine peptidase, partial [Lysobacter sp. 2RAB21]
MSTRSNTFNALAVATMLALGAGSASAADRADLRSLDADGSQSFGRLLVTYKPGTAPRRDSGSFNQAIGAAASATSNRLGGGKHAVQLKRLRRTSGGADVVLSNRPLSRVEAVTLMRQIAADPNVLAVSNDIRMVPYFTPNDTQFKDQYGFGTGAGGIRATQAWDVTKGEGAVVAVIDTGIVNHSDLNANVIAGYDMISGDNPADGLPSPYYIANDGNGRDANPADPGDGISISEYFSNAAVNKYCGYGSSTWHGTHVSGTVAALTNNAKGVAGTAPAAKIVPVRVLGRCGGYSSDIADAITWASGGSVPGVPANPNPADVINMSLGSKAPVACPQIYKDALAGAVARGSIVVVAAGNSKADSLTAKNADGQVVG